VERVICTWIGRGRGSVVDALEVVAELVRQCQECNSDDFLDVADEMNSDGVVLEIHQSQ